MTQKQIDAYLRLMDPQILEERTHQDKSGVYGIAQRLAGYHSNHIEGSLLTPEQTADLFKTGTREQDQTAVRMKDVEDMSGHFRILNEALKTIHQPFTQDLIRQFHILLKSGVWEDCINNRPAGEYKIRTNTVAVLAASPQEAVEADMARLICEYREILKPSLQDLAAIDARFETIHPFHDGNGRTGQIILFRQSLKHVMFQVIVRDSQKPAYYAGLKEYQKTGQVNGLTDVFRRAQDLFLADSYDFAVPYNYSRDK